MSSESRRRVGEAEIERLVGAAQAAFASEANVIAAYLFGSAARGEPARDLDIGVVLRPGPVDFHALDRIACEIQDRGAPGGPEVDLRALNQGAPRFLANVLRDGRLLYEADRAQRIAFEARAMSRWLDFRPDWKRMRSAMHERWRA